MELIWIYRMCERPGRLSVALQRIPEERSAEKAPRMIIGDSGFWIALANRNDSWHQRAVVALEKLTEPLVTTWPVLTEVCYLLSSRLGEFATLRFIHGVAEGKCIVFTLDGNHVSRCADLMTKYKALPMDLADASLVVLAEELGDGRILSTDQRDFKTYRWKNRKPFKNLLG
jgi:uncharacterized protein